MNKSLIQVKSTKTNTLTNTENETHEKTVSTKFGTKLHTIFRTFKSEKNEKFEIAQEDSSTDSTDTDRNKQSLKKVNIADFINSTSAVEKNSHPSITIEAIDTQIHIDKDSTKGLITEVITYKLSNGLFDSITKKLSLEGTSDKLNDFHLISSDLKLTAANSIKNCHESSYYNTHDHLCIVAKFEEIDASEAPVTVKIGYEYTAENILKKRDKPFSMNEEKENVLIWVYDNFNKLQKINNVFLSIKIASDTKIDVTKIIAYPEKNVFVSNLN